MSFERNDYAKDPVVQDEAAHDRLGIIAEQQMDIAMDAAHVEYEAGELDDWISDDCDPSDTFKLAHALVQWYDEIMEISHKNLPSAATASEVMQLSARIVRRMDMAAYVGLKRTIKHVIKEKAEMIRSES